MKPEKTFPGIVIPVLTGATLAMASAPAQWQFTDDRLDNGMRVLVMEDHRTPLVNVQVWYHVGSKDEDPNRQGFAHMFEHMMFRGTDRIGPQDHFKYLQRYGGKVNGYTSFDMTVYWETVPASQLDRALWLEAERLGRLKINEDYFAAEREVVKEERRMRTLNRPYGKLYESLFAAAFKEHPYRWTPIGNMPHLDASTAEELQAFFNRYYVPNNATLVVVGDVKREHVLAKAKEYFGDLPRRPDPPRVTIQEPPAKGPQRVELTDRAPSPMVVLAYHAPDARDPDAIPMEILARILSTGQSSRLYRHLVQGKEIAVSVSASDNTLEQAGLFTLSATLKPNVSVEEGEQALLAELRELLEKGVDDNELQKAKNQVIAEDVRTRETVQGRADQLGYAAVILGDANRVNTDLERKRAVTEEQMLAVARRVFTDANRTTLVIRPDPAPPKAEETQDKSRKAEKVVDLPPPADMPAGKTPEPVDLPRPATRTLANGLKVLVLQDRSVSAVTLSYNMLIGAKNDPPEKAGLATVTASTLRRGTKRFTGDALAELIDFHAMSLSEAVNHEDTKIRLWTLSEHVKLAADTLAEVLRNPVFPESEVANYVSRAAAREAINEHDPGTIASRAFDRVVYGENYLGRPEGGTAKTLKHITRDDTAEFHRRYFAPDMAVLTFAGDIAPEQAFELAEQYFGDWNARSESVSSPPPPAPRPLTVFLVDRPVSVQSEIRIGEIVPVSRRDPDYAAVRLVSQIFGESFSGRLNRSLRIEKGLTYGASGYFDVDAKAAAFRIGTFTRTEKTADAVRAALEETTALTKSTITQAELDEARDTLLGGFQMALETPSQIAARYWDLVVWGLPENWYGQYLRDVAATKDPKALNDAAGRKLAPDRLAIVIVGKGEAIRDELAKIAPVTSMPAN